MEYVWIVLGGPMEAFEGVFKTRRSARLYAAEWIRAGRFSRVWYKIKKVPVGI